MLIQGKEVSKKIMSEIENKIKEKNLKINVTAISFKGDTESSVYFNNIAKNAAKVGINFKIEEVAAEELIPKIRSLNYDDEVDSIIIARPFPEGIDSVEVGDSIDPDKDLDCISPYNLGRLNYKDYDIAPATAKAAIDILKYNNIKLSGLNTLIINRSITVGRPLSLMLLHEDSTVTVAHTKTRDILKEIENSDIVFVAVGRPAYLKSSQLKSKKIIVDIGINVVENKILGDFEYDTENKLIDYTPVPGGVGSVTSSEILLNAVNLKLRK